MKLLIDTCVVLWLMLDSKKISPTLRDIIASPTNSRYLSSVVVWESIVKWQLGKLKLPKQPSEFFPEVKERGKFKQLPIHQAAALQLQKLPKLHADPFDRMLICQAIEDGMTIVTPDPLIEQYPIKVLWM
jgi:PIN domain nuclease of toxin-antitoxin system